MSHQETTDEIDVLVTQYVQQGLLLSVKPINPPGRDYVTVDIYAGSTPDRSMVDLHLRLSRLEREQLTVEHEPVGIRWAMSLSATSYRPKARTRSDANCDSGGQILDKFRRVIGDRGTLGERTAIAEIADIWQAHHMNDVTAGCVHVPEPVWEDEPYRRPDLVNTPACPETGYRWGSAWLYRELPSEAVHTLLKYLATRPPAGEWR